MNRNEYKKSMSGIHPSEQVVERIMDITVDKKANKGFIIKRVASAVLALALLISGGFGINHVVDSNRPLGVMVSYAKEFMKVKSGTKQTMINGVYFAPADDEKKCKIQYEKAQKDYNEIVAEIEKLDEDDIAAWEGIGQFEICDKKGNVVAKLYTSGAGYFVADKDDYKNVKSLTVENESDDGYLQLEWHGVYDLIVEHTEEGSVDSKNPYSDFINHKFTLTGEELRDSQKNNFNEYGYRVNWVPTPTIFEAEGYRYDKDFKASAIKDKITFTFEYEDGSTESTSINISFDDYGHMQLS